MAPSITLNKIAAVWETIFQGYVTISIQINEEHQ